MSEKKCRVAVFASGTGTNLQALIDASQSKDYPAQIVLVISDKEEAMALKRASKHGISNIVIPYSDDNGKTTADITIKELKKHDIDLIILAGYMRILHVDLIRAYPNKIINIHPSLIPNYCGKGFYGDRVHKAVLADKCEYSGITIHFVDEGVDTGDIIYQQKIKIEDGETVDSLKAKIHKLEHASLVKVVGEEASKLINM